MNTTLEAVKQAEANLRPAKAGYATGTFYLAAPNSQNADRPNLPPVDRTLGVFKVESVSGEPIAFIVNTLADQLGLSGRKPAPCPEGEENGKRRGCRPRNHPWAELMRRGRLMCPPQCIAISF